MREAVPPHIPVTVKMRRGLDDCQASRDNFYKIFDGAFQRGVAAITVHGRTVRQRYVGPSRWEFLREVKQHAGRRIVLGSGDLFTPQACLDMIAQTGVDGVTAARGAIGNPWIFSQARALAAGSAGRAAQPGRAARGHVEHYRLAERHLRPQSHLRRHAEVRHSRLADAPAGRWPWARTWRRRPATTGTPWWRSGTIIKRVPLTSRVPLKEAKQED